MGLLEMASGRSFHSGLYYYQNGAVLSYENISDALFRGVVRGTKDYIIVLDIDHPKKSTCNCPYAEGKSIICKHKVALYLALFPDEVKRIEKEQKAYEVELEKMERRRERFYKKKLKEIREYVQSLSIKNLREALTERMVADLYELDTLYLDDEENED